MDMWLGEQLRLRRKQLRKSLKEVADGAEISVSLLSQMERGLRSVSIQTLHGLAEELDTPIETFLANLHVEADQTDDARGAVTRAGSHRSVDSAKLGGIHKEILTPPVANGSNLQLYRAVIEPGGSTGPTFFTTQTGHQIGYVVSGQLELQLAERLLSLKTGDSFWYDNAMPRRWRNPGEEQAVVLWAVSAV
ncbi:helix-turn-helix transcriptional regulator [Acuticoccus sp. 2012]|uniref:Helix-turn-helix transcriptional regulator n=2 Tax=Acuticoccus mangrovi TaxID=2796142 RepID=A0A934ITP6_9HYPH|nr:helix-turn-helix transcriptional regulator [Acuticoccus mangrovi]